MIYVLPYLSNLFNPLYQSFISYIIMKNSITKLEVIIRLLCVAILILLLGILNNVTCQTLSVTSMEGDTGWAIGRALLSQTELRETNPEPNVGMIQEIMGTNGLDYDDIVPVNISFDYDSAELVQLYMRECTSPVSEIRWLGKPMEDVVEKVFIAREENGFNIFWVHNGEITFSCSYIGDYEEEYLIRRSHQTLIMDEYPTYAEKYEQTLIFTAEDWEVAYDLAKPL